MSLGDSPWCPGVGGGGGGDSLRGLTLVPAGEGTLPCDLRELTLVTSGGGGGGGGGGRTPVSLRDSPRNLRG